MEYVDRVFRNGERFVLTHDAKPVAKLSPVALPKRLGDLAKIMETLSRLTPEDAEQFAADLADIQSNKQFNERTIASHG